MSEHIPDLNTCSLVGWWVETQEKGKMARVTVLHHLNINVQILCFRCWEMKIITLELYFGRLAQLKQMVLILKNIFH